jgi:RNA-directed DNA polymerase
VQTSDWFLITIQIWEDMNEDRQIRKILEEKSSSNLCGFGSLDWNSINWKKVEKSVSRLQARIVKAEKEGRIGKAKALQILLTKSFGGKALAVKRVTENQGKKTPGVDGILWNTPDRKAKAIQQLRRKGYKAKALRRVYIPKSNGKKRPLGIPTMKDRAMQALYQLALDPISETRADNNSFGFRRYRSTADTIERCFNVLAGKRHAHWALEGDIKGCFDNISKEWLLENIPMDKKMLKTWLDAGFIHNGVFHETVAGTPQGGIISPMLANMTLDGMEAALTKKVGKKSTDRGRVKKVNLVRYADDFIITGASREVLEKEVKPLIVEFLSERGLILSEEKTTIVHIDEGFDFLGQNVRKYSGKLLIKPSKKNVEIFLKKVRETIKGNATIKAVNLIYMLNPIIRGWANYHRHVVSRKVFEAVDDAIWRAIWKWVRRRHPNKSQKWVKSKYFTTVGGDHWTFFGTDENGRRWTLFNASSIPIKRHIKIRKDVNPYDPAWKTYLEKRKEK